MIDKREDRIASCTANGDAGKEHTCPDSRWTSWQRTLELAPQLNLIAIIRPITILNLTASRLNYKLSMGILPCMSSIPADIGNRDGEHAGVSMQSWLFSHIAA